MNTKLLLKLILIYFSIVLLMYNGISLAAWTSMESGTTATLYGVWGSTGSAVFAVGTDGTILHYDGSIWTEMDNTSS